MKTLVKSSELILEEDKLTVSEIIEHIQRRSTGEEVSPTSLLVAINGVESSTLQGLETVVSKGDTVTIIPVVHGG